MLVCYLENVALGKSVWEDRPWRDRSINWGADKAVDGRYDNRSAWGGQCVITESFAETATLRVDLGDMVNISHINLYYRTDNLPRMPISHNLLIYFLFVRYLTDFFILSEISFFLSFSFHILDMGYSVIQVNLSVVWVLNLLKISFKHAYRLI